MLAPVEMKRLHWQDMSCSTVKEADAVIMGIPFDGGASNGKGAFAAPDRLRELSRIVSCITEEGHNFKALRVFDAGDVPVNLNWEKYFYAVEEKAKSFLDRDKFCLFIGGDHSVTIPLQTAFARAYQDKKVGIIHFDSHTDIADEYDGHHWSHACTQRRALELPNVNPEGLTFLGIRSYMEDEIEFLERHPGINVLGAREIYRRGIDSIAAEVKSHYAGYDAIYVTIDIDVLDPAFAPGTGTPEAGGLSTRELIELSRDIVQTLPVKALDIVEVAPPLDVSDITSWAALKIVYEVFGVHAGKKGKVKSFKRG